MKPEEIFASGSAWAMLPSTLDALARLETLPEPPADLVAAVTTKRGIVRHAGSFRAGVIGSVGVLPLFGPVFFRQQWEMLAQDLGTLLDDPEVKSILLDIDSPGGIVTGTQEASDLLFEARGRKPIIAFSSGWAASAAYFIASAADQVVIAESGAAGSIGVVGVHIDIRQALERMGIRMIEVVSAQSPKKRADPATDEGRALLQRRVDTLAELFVDRVARNRNVTADRVLADFGQGDMPIGRDAVRAGLADRVGSFNSLLDELGAGSSARTSPSRPAVVGREAQPAAPDSSGASASAQMSAVEQVAGPFELGRDAERRRITLLLDMAHSGAEQYTAAAVEAGTTAGEFARALLAAAYDGADVAIGPPAPADPPPALAHAHAEFTAGIGWERARAVELMRAELPEGFESARLGAVRWGKSLDELHIEVATTIRDRGVTLERLRADAPTAAPHGGQPDGDPKKRDAAGWEKAAAKIAKERGA